MQKFSILIIALLVFIEINFSQVDARMTMTQIRNAMKPLGKTCLGKTGLSKELQAGQHEGQFPEDEALMKYHECLLKLSKIADKTGKINLESMLKQIDMMMPEDIIEQAKTVTTECYNEIQSEENPRLSFEFVRCYFLKAPEITFFP